MAKKKTISTKPSKTSSVPLNPAPKPKKRRAPIQPKKRSRLGIHKSILPPGDNELGGALDGFSSEQLEQI